MEVLNIKHFIIISLIIIIILGVITFNDKTFSSIINNDNIKENFYGMNFIDHNRYLECCKHYGCNSWICQNFLYYTKPFMKYVGIITSISYPQKIFSLFKRYNQQSNKFEYFYRKISGYYDYKFYKIESPKHNNDYNAETISESQSLSGRSDNLYRETIEDGEIILVDGQEYIVNMQAREGIPINTYVHKSLHGSKPHYGRFFGYNAIYDKYYPYLYKRPVHFAIGGGFKTTIAKFAILKPVENDKINNTNIITTDYDIENDNIILYEKEINPHYNEYAYYIKYRGEFIELPIGRKMNDGDIINIPYFGDKQFKVEKITFHF